MNWQHRKAIPYLRVSTDDQADRGYSLPDQEERLRKFCEMFQITIVQIFKDDHSAKTFNRPGWQELLLFIKKNRNSASLLLFTNWSRFSRSENMGETYMQIENLMRLGIEAQAIEQPLDLSIPENRLVMAFYIAQPMVENIRRSDNVTRGIRKSFKNGRYCVRAPFGYQNTRDPQDRPLLAINAPQAQIIEGIFIGYLNGQDPKLIMKQARKKGLTKTGHSTFTEIIFNPLYAGLIKVRAYKEEREEIVKAIHEPIIDPAIFWAVKRKYETETGRKPKIYTDQMPLRGCVQCDSCGKALTGGRSKGRNRHYDYYRCHYCRGQNFKAETLHEELTQILSSVSFQPEHIDQFIKEVEINLKGEILANLDEAGKLKKEIAAAQQSLQSLETKYIADKISFETYQKYFPHYNMDISTKQIRLNQITGDKEHILDLCKQALPKMMNLSLLYQKADLQNKQELLSLIFVGGLFRSKSGYRTAYLNPMFDLKLATTAGLVISDKLQTGVICPILDDSGLSRNQIEPLLRFVLKLEAA